MKENKRGIDVRGNRAARNYSAGEMVRRVLWGFGQWMVRLSPRPCFAWRRMVLRCFGCRVGAQVHVYPSTRILFPWKLRIGDWSALGEDVRVYNPGPIVIGRRVTISHGAHLCSATHDHTDPELPILKRPIGIGRDAWLCADSFLGPGARVGAGTVVGARAVVTGRVAPWTVVAGNPARPISRRKLQSGPLASGTSTEASGRGATFRR